MLFIKGTTGLSPMCHLFGGFTVYSQSFHPKVFAIQNLDDFEHFGKSSKSGCLVQSILAWMVMYCPKLDAS